MLDLIIAGGRVVTPQGADVMDVGVQGDKIAAVGWPGTLAAGGARVIDATGKLVGKSDAGRWLKRRVVGDVLGRPAV